MNHGDVTDVFITRFGRRFHRIADCPSFDDSEQRTGTRVYARPVALRGLPQQQCAVCWPGIDEWEHFALEVERTGDSEYEVMFVAQVLRNVRELSPGDVRPETKAYGASGATYFIDFLIQTAGRQIAVEIDGKDKSPGFKTPDQIQVEVDTKRADLRSAGWRVLNFTNVQVATRPDQCVTELRAELVEAVAPRADVAKAALIADAPSEPSPAHGASHWTIISLLVGAIALVVAGVVAWAALVGGSGVTPSDGHCPADAPVKGNRSASGERIYHEPGWEFYERTTPEECFATSKDAQEAGYRASERR